MGEPALKSVEERTEEAILATKAAFSDPKRGPEVVRIDHKVGADWTGDDAIHFIVVLRDPVGSDGTALYSLDEVQPIDRMLRSELRRRAIDHTPYFRFQLESEQKAISRGSYDADEEEWVYRATRSKAPFDVTQGIALHDGFLCRSLHTKAMQRVANVKNVKIGDIIHFYYRAPSEMEGWKASGRFSGPLPGTSLARVEDPVLEVTLARYYDKDSKLHVFTGWTLKAADIITPPYRTDMFPGHGSLYLHSVDLKQAVAAR